MITAATLAVHFIVLVGSIAVLNICACVEVMLALRVWRDCRLSRLHAWYGTAWAVMVFGSLAALCGIGAYTVAQSAVASLLGVL